MRRSPWRPVPTVAEAVRIALLGFGRLGHALAARIDRAAARVAVFDSAFARCGSAPALALRGSGVEQFASARGAAAEARLVIAAVPASAAVEAARSAAQGIEPGAFFLDLSGVRGAASERSRGAIERSGGRYLAGRHVNALLLVEAGLQAPALASFLDLIGLPAIVAGSVGGTVVPLVRTRPASPTGTPATVPLLRSGMIA